MKRLALIAGAAVVAVTAAACSSSSSTSASGGGSTPSTPASAAATGSTGASSSSTAAAATGTPYKVFFINEQGASATASDPEDTSAAEAAVDYINKNLGGIKGRPVQLTTCATLGT